ncbi:hypothetical protein BU15DRAFT_87392 [Melanogaster broomeanus]|nr:hypothetical protein BU15DRAFT_87392 [Melanogaster broomeanus]
MGARTRMRTRTRSTSHSSVASQSSILSIYDKICQGSPVAEPTEGFTNVYGSFTTTTPAAFWLRTYLKLNIPLSADRRGKLLAPCRLIYDWDGPPTGSVPSPITTAPPSPLMDDAPFKLHPVLEAVEKSSKLSYRTTCSTCLKSGRDFPRCPRCNDMWCSRECRLQGGKRHVCAVPTM